MVYSYHVKVTKKFPKGEIFYYVFGVGRLGREGRLRRLGSLERLRSLRNLRSEREFLVRRS